MLCSPDERGTTDHHKKTARKGNTIAAVQPTLCTKDLHPSLLRPTVNNRTEDSIRSTCNTVCVSRVESSSVFHFSFIFWYNKIPYAALRKRCVMGVRREYHRSSHLLCVCCNLGLFIANQRIHCTVLARLHYRFRIVASHSFSIVHYSFIFYPRIVPVLTRRSMPSD